MKRLAGFLAAAGLAAAAVLVFVSGAGAVTINCAEPEANALCTEPLDSIGYGDEYTGHDEVSLLFYENTPGSGNSSKYEFTLPTDPNVLPNQVGTAGTWNFQLHIAYWFGMVLCDNQSAPEFTHAPCAPDSDTNIFDGSDPAAADYIGKHPGTAFLELQFYPPGWAPFRPTPAPDSRRFTPCQEVAHTAASSPFRPTPRASARRRDSSSARVGLRTPTRSRAPRPAP